ncbi:MAG TPA: glycine betaine ABC transporter substrate-binding protein [Gemmatimonadaceae bacterium]|nr:glycine betaine ABC transporter substrate-binding protein [Gemmatimonadaceae bacterium]
MRLASLRGARAGRALGISAAAVALTAAASARTWAQEPLPRDSSRALVVASKPFGESYLLAEMFAQLLAANGLAVDRRPGLGATEIAFGALRAGQIDVYPEYTGTGLLVILHDSAFGTRSDVYGVVSREFARQFGVRWLPPLGFQNTYAIAVRRETAKKLGLKTLTDLARAAAQLRAGFTPDFIGRADGLPGLQRVYGLRLREVHALLPAVKYKALASGSVDVIDGYSTDGLIARYDLVVLEDDKRFFPPYEAAALVGARLASTMPRAIAALTALSGRLDESEMRRLNERVEVEGEPVERVAADALRAMGLVPSDAAASTHGGQPSSAPTGIGDLRMRHSLGAYLWDRRALIARLTARHALLVGFSLLAAVLIAVPLGLLLERARSGAEPVIRAVGVIQTIPGIALLAFMIPLFGIGIKPALVALLLYSIFPILRNTYTGVRDADPGAVRAARALGMTESQVLRYVRLPLAAGVIMAGIRTAAVILVGTATLAAFIGAGGLGDPIVSGLALSDTQMILSGAIPAALLALLVDIGLGQVEKRARSVGAEGGGAAVS